MPYIIEEFEDGYRVCKKDNPTKCFSNKSLPLETAKKQEKAIILSEMKGGNRGAYWAYRPLMPIEGGALTHRLNFIKKNKLEDKPYSLQELSKISSVPLEILQEVYNRGIGAHKTNLKSVRLKGSYVKNVDAPPSQKLSKEQWAIARVYSFLDGSTKHDNDLRRNMMGGALKHYGLEENMMGGHLDYKDIDNELYLTIAKAKAQHSGYNPDLLNWADDKIHKLNYNGVKFGRLEYNDFIVYAIRAYNKDITNEEALKKRENYRARATKIKGNWKNNKESPNNLAINILW